MQKLPAGRHRAATSNIAALNVMADAGLIGVLRRRMKVPNAGTVQQAPRQLLQVPQFCPFIVDQPCPAQQTSLASRVRRDEFGLLRDTIQTKRTYSSKKAPQF